MFDGNSDIALVAFNTTLEGIIITDSDAKIVMTNMAIESIFGYSAVEIVGKDLHMFVPEALRKIHLEHYKSYAKDPKYLSFDNAREIIGVHKDGRKLPLELKLSQFHHKNKNYAQAIITDITVRKAKEKRITMAKMKLEKKVKDYTAELEKVVKQLRQTNQDLEVEIKKKIYAKQKARKALIAERELGQLKTKFLSMASHEFRTPLSGILTSVTLIGKYTPKEKKNVTKHVKVIKTMVNHLSNILDDFLSLDRLESGQVHYKFSKFGFNRLMEKIIKETSSLLKKGQRINYIPCKICPKLYQDKRIVHIILSNIIFNAIKYSPEESTIDIAVEAGEMVIITVTDEGIGIPENEQKDIFTRFYRASNATHLQGTGIGLNIVKANVEGLGGTITFKSKENEGTTFIVKLPKNVIV